MFKKELISLLIIVLVGQGFFGFAKKAESEEMPLVVINELMWMGSDLSAYDEWVELKNATATEIDLSGWYLTKNSSGTESLMLKIPAGETVEPNGLFVISNYGADSVSCALADEPDLADSDVSLVNSGLKIKLYDSAGNLVDTADDGSGGPLAGEYVSGSTWKSMERNKTITDGTLASSWHTAAGQAGLKPRPVYGTPGQENSNTVPIAEAGGGLAVLAGETAYFDASESFDPDGDELIFSWDFGDGNTGNGLTPTHIYDEIGEYPATLTVSDGVNQATDTLLVQVAEEEEIIFELEPEEEGDDSEPEISDPETEADNSGEIIDDPEENYDFSGKILLNEIFPNPEGSDNDYEFIELISRENRTIKLAGWQIFNGKKYINFKEGTAIKPGGFLVLKYADTKTYLVNSGGSFELLDPAKKVIDRVEYGQASEGESFARFPGGNDWAWTLEVTEGEANIILEEEVEVEEEIEKEEEPEKEVKEEVEEEIKTAAEELELTIAEAKELEKGKQVTVRGFVSVAPAVFGTQYFYLFDGEAGIKIYSSKKLFPALKIGDYVQVTGKTSESTGEKKINTSKLEDIKRLSDQDDFPEAMKVSISEINNDLAGSLVLMSGLVLDSAKTKIIFSDETGEIEVYLKSGAGINGNDYAEGSEAEILGIVIPYQEGFRLLPRAESDLRVVESPEILEAEAKETDEALAKTSGKVLGAKEINEIEIPPAENKNPLKIYLIVILLGLALCGGALAFRWHKAKKQTA